MKKIRNALLALLLSLCAVTMLASCGGSNPDKLVSDYEEIMTEYVSMMKDYSKDQSNVKLLENAQKILEKSTQLEKDIESLKDKLSEEEWEDIEKRMNAVEAKVSKQLLF